MCDCWVGRRDAWVTALWYCRVVTLTSTITRMNQVSIFTNLFSILVVWLLSVLS